MMESIRRKRSATPDRHRKKGNSSYYKKKRERSYDYVDEKSEYKSDKHAFVDSHKNNEKYSKSSNKSKTRNKEKQECGNRYWDDDDDPPYRKNSDRYWNKYSRENRVIGSRYYDKYKSDTENKVKNDSENNEINENLKKSNVESKTKHESARIEDKGKEQSSKKVLDPITSRTGGAYIPPAKLKMMQASITDKSSVEYQRIAWEALKKSIHGLINKVNTSNITHIIKQLFRENIIRGRGLLCRSIIQAQAVSPTFTHVYAALVALVNSRFPNIGELLLKRLIIQFKRGFKRNDKTICTSSTRFIAHLVNQRVAHEIIALEILTLLVETPTDYSIEVAISFLKECGMRLTVVSKKGIDAIFEVLKNILHEGKLSQRVMYIIEVLFHIRKDEFKGHEAVIESLDLIEEEDQFTHLLSLEDATDGQDVLNVFKYDPQYIENEEKFKVLSKEMLGESSESGSDFEDEDEDESDEDENKDDKNGEEDKQLIIDKTETNLVSLRREIYLTIYSSLDFEECAHKLMKMELKPGQESELCNMILDCCCEMRSYEKFFGLLAERFCRINKIYVTPFQNMFQDSYATVYRLKPNQLRNVAKFFAHLLFEDAISWEVMSCIMLNEEDTTSSGRIFIKILFQELSENMGLRKLNERLKDATLQVAFSGLFPRNNPKNTRFAINFFTSIGLGGLTDDLREHLKSQIKSTQLQPESSSSSASDSSESSSDSDEDSSDDDSSDEISEDETSSSDSKSEENRHKKSKTSKKKTSVHKKTKKKTIEKKKSRHSERKKRRK